MIHFTDNTRRIVREKHVQDGTTSGHIILIDNYGNQYLRCNGPTGGTNESIFQMDKDGNISQSTSLT